MRFGNTVSLYARLGENSYIFMNILFDVEQFKRCLVETIAWCVLRASVDSPAHSLRAPELQPHVCCWLEWKHGEKLAQPEQMEHVGLEVATVENRHLAVDELATRRATLLRLDGIPPTGFTFNPAEGRLLFYSPELNHLYSGEPEIASAEFFDTENSPPWDTWVYYVSDDKYYPKPHEYYCDGWEDYLICWVPKSVMRFADAGVRADSEIDKCIRWGDEVDTNYTRLLRTAGLFG